MECHVELCPAIGFLYRNRTQHPKPEAVFLPKSKLVMLKNHLLLNLYRHGNCTGSSNSDLEPCAKRWNFRYSFSVFHSPQPEKTKAGGFKSPGTENRPEVRI